MAFGLPRGTKCVWACSSGRAGALRTPHTLGIDPGRCWTWASTGRAVVSHGHPLTGDFRVEASWYAEEFKQSDYIDITL